MKGRRAMGATYRKFLGKIREAFEGEIRPGNLAAAFAVGVFFSFTPLVSLHMVLALLVAFIFRLSKLAAVAGVWVNNPYTMPFVFYGCFRLGEAILGLHVPPPSFERFSLGAFLKAAKPYVAPLFLGTTIVGIIASLLAYVIVYRIAVRLKSARQKAPSEGGPPP